MFSLIEFIMKKNNSRLQWLKNNIPWLFSGVGVAIITIFISLIISNKSENKTVVNNTISSRDSSTHTTIINNFIKSESIKSNPIIIQDTLDLTVLKSIISARKNIDAELCYQVIHTKSWMFNENKTFDSFFCVSENPPICIQMPGKWKLLNNDNEMELVFDKYPSNSITLNNLIVNKKGMIFELTYRKKAFYRISLRH